MAKYVVFEYNKDTFQYTARFYKNGEQVEWKRLTDVEEENLADYLDKLDTKIPVEDLLEARDSGDWQDDDGDITNFELILNDLVKED